MDDVLEIDLPKFIILNAKSIILNAKSIILNNKLYTLIFSIVLPVPLGSVSFGGKLIGEITVIGCRPNLQF